MCGSYWACGLSSAGCVANRMASAPLRLLVALASTPHTCHDFDVAVCCTTTRPQHNLTLRSCALIRVSQLALVCTTDIDRVGGRAERPCTKRTSDPTHVHPVTMFVNARFHGHPYYRQTPMFNRALFQPPCTEKAPARWNACCIACLRHLFAWACEIMKLQCGWVHCMRDTVTHVRFKW